MSTAVDKPITNSIHTAISLGPDVHDWIIYTHAPRILHIFEHACNLVNERGEVISLVSQGVGNGPFNLVFSPQSSEVISKKIHSTTPISLCWPGLKIGDVLIDLRQAIHWNAEPDWPGLVKKRSVMASNLHFHMNWLLKQAHPDSLLSLFSRTKHTPKSGAENLTELQKITNLKTSYPTSLATGRLNGLFEAIHSVDLETCRFIAQRLAGSGLGLTPAGDDFLFGAIIATWIIHPREKAELIASSIASATLSRTNTLSAAWIQAAARGLVNETWMELLNLLSLDRDLSIESSLHKLLSVGHTSGADALAGFTGCLTHGMVQLDSEPVSVQQYEYELKDPGVAVPLWD